ncbi:MAG: NAD(P)-dependent glycerol-3-phosphate dehydrogenase [Verrucomicrobia bacterium]|nr:NAD(P)-dependent glycerol-3-phosphate dehydrogenase [Verrucomicrobiota bacterium]MBI3869900.1 NAD(P)-dependent glycerol-3-phosphate dehydrogenase [Verrucomicrobiota bacterium]
MRVAILGAGAWGTALAIQLDRGGHSIRLWGHSAEHLREMEQSGANARYLPGVALPQDWKFEPSAEVAVRNSDAVVVAVPSRAFREGVKVLASYPGIVVSVTKGIEYATGLTMCGILREVLTSARGVAALSGPSLAMEVAQGIPTAVVAASSQPEIAEVAQGLFTNSTFRVYTSGDELGVEMGGALKNVVAIAAGVCDGLGFGENSKAALITRGIVEMRRLGVACGAQPETFSGLSGLGDLAVTCFSKLSRNRAFGERIGRGESAADIQAGSVSVAEGYPTSKSAFQLARQLKVPTPIIDEVHAMLHESKPALEAVKALMTRGVKAE